VTGRSPESFELAPAAHSPAAGQRVGGSMSSFAGMSPETAIAAVLLYRISTYYLPPAWRFPAMVWLQRNRYL
jgi:hypothetical protein